MRSFCVTWNIDIDAETEREAAEIAREIQLDPNSTATFFEVQDMAVGDGTDPTIIDLSEEAS